METSFKSLDSFTGYNVVVKEDFPMLVVDLHGVEKLIEYTYDKKSRTFYVSKRVYEQLKTLPGKI